MCSRLEQYERLRSRLCLRGAVVVQPLTRSEVREQLRLADGALTGLRAAVDRDDELADLLTTPLFLGVAAAAYEGVDRATLRGPSGAAAFRDRLWSDYVTAMLRRPRASRRAPPPELTLHWLTWLARMMRSRSQTIFFLDWIQPDWLPTPAQGPGRGRWRIVRSLSPHGRRQRSG